MILVDSSALMAIIVGEPGSGACADAITAYDRVAIAAPTLTEVMIVAAGRALEREMRDLLADLDLEIIPLTESLARKAAEAYRQWGRGFHPAKLNFGDCFAYAVARAYDCPLLFVGADFAQTDVKPVI